MTDDPDSPSLNVAVALLDPNWSKALPQLDTLVSRAAAAVWAAVPPAARGALPAEVSVALAGDALVRDLNRDYRGQDKATNVLAFPAGEPFEVDVLRLLGDIVIARETLLAEAAAQGKSPADHLSHLVVHGLLHLLGFDHEEEREAEAMEALEARILSGLGVADPYALRHEARESVR